MTALRLAPATAETLDRSLGDDTADEGEAEDVGLPSSAAARTLSVVPYWRRSNMDSHGPFSSRDPLSQRTVLLVFLGLLVFVIIVAGVAWSHRTDAPARGTIRKLEEKIKEEQKKHGAPTPAGPSKKLREQLDALHKLDATKPGPPALPPAPPKELKEQPERVPDTVPK